MGKLANDIAVVTGGGSGIGKAVVQLFAHEGAAVVIVHHHQPEDARALVEEIEAAGGRAIAIGADVQEEEQVDGVFDQAQQSFGTPTLLVNAAGVDASGVPVADMELEQFEKVLRTNLVGPFLFARAFVRGCKAAKARGKIINISSVHEDIPRAGAADYCASKGVLTPMNQGAIDDPKVREEQTASIPMKRAAEPEEVAELALYLASRAADYATGATFTLDGGLQMNLGQGA